MAWSNWFWITGSQFLCIKPHARPMGGVCPPSLGKYKHSNQKHQRLSPVSSHTTITNIAIITLLIRPATGLPHCQTISRLTGRKCVPHLRSIFSTKNYPLFLSHASNRVSFPLASPLRLITPPFWLLRQPLIDLLINWPQTFSMVAW